LRERVLRPLGVPDSEWSVGYGATFTVDGLPLVATWGGGAFYTRARRRAWADWFCTRAIGKAVSF
jgi:hypothetical protein